MKKTNILITGCSTGIGKQTALYLKELGYEVFASTRKQEDVLMLEKLGLKTFLIDVTKKETITKALQEILLLKKVLQTSYFDVSKLTKYSSISLRDIFSNSKIIDFDFSLIRIDDTPPILIKSFSKFLTLISYFNTSQKYLARFFVL